MVIAILYKYKNFYLNLWNLKRKSFFKQKRYEQVDIFVQ